jgi:hypothetical protein
MSTENVDKGFEYARERLLRDRDCPGDRLGRKRRVGDTNLHAVRTPKFDDDISRRCTPED